MAKVQERAETEIKELMDKIERFVHGASEKMRNLLLEAVIREHCVAIRRIMELKDLMKTIQLSFARNIVRTLKNVRLGLRLLI